MLQASLEDRDPILTPDQQTQNQEQERDRLLKKNRVVKAHAFAGSACDWLALLLLDCGGAVLLVLGFCFCFLFAVYSLGSPPPSFQINTQKLILFL